MSASRLGIAVACSWIIVIERQRKVWEFNQRVHGYEIHTAVLQDVGIKYNDSHYYST